MFFSLINEVLLEGILTKLARLFIAVLKFLFIVCLSFVRKNLDENGETV